MGRLRINLSNMEIKKFIRVELIVPILFEMNFQNISDNV